jgi:hypothetical protein
MLSSVSVAPHSATAFAFGSQSSTAASSSYALRRTGSHWSKEAVKVPGGTVQLFQVAAGSPHSAWIVGNTFGTTDKVLIEHSAGGGFKPLKTKLGQGQLLAVSASSPSNTWAVGDGLASATPLIAHWNGKKWAAIPDTKQVDTNLSVVSTSSPSNVWMLGSGPSGVIADVWNGHKLSVKSISVPTGAAVDLIATTSAKNTWLAGSITTGTTVQHTRPFTEHWNGKKWSVIKGPQLGNSAQTTGLSASGSHAYLAGTDFSKSGLTQTAFVLRYTGGKWKLEKTASPGHIATLSAISVSSVSGAAVGSWSVNGECGVKHPTPFLPLVESLHGSSWRKESAPLIRTDIASILLAASATPRIPAC